MHMSFESKRVRQITASPSMMISMMAKKLRSEGREVVDMSLGEPDFDTPAHIIEAGYRAMRDGKTRYTGPAGLIELREAIVRKLARENGLTYTPDEITVANGAKQIIFNALLATLESGDEVIVPTPYWVSYTDMVTLHGGTPKLIQCGMESGFKLTPALLEAAIAERTRWIILNSPSNPSGAIYSREDFAALGEVLTRHPRVLVMSDEIYEHIVLGDLPFVSFGIACPGLRDRTLLINGVSKAYAMTGWRIGYAAGPQALIAALSKIQSQSTTSASSISQVAAITALDGEQDFVAASLAQYRTRGKVLVDGLASIAGLQLQAPQGSFYAYPSCAALIGKRTPTGEVIASDADLSTYLLKTGGVAAVPGSAFGLSPYFRLSFATSMQNIEMAIVRIRKALSDLH